MKKQCISQAYDNWFGWIKTKKDYRVHPEKYTGEPKMPKYKYRKKTHNIVSIDKTRFRKKVSNENKIGIPRTNYEITIPSNLKKEWIVMLKIRFINDYKFKITFIYD